MRYRSNVLNMQCSQSIKIICNYNRTIINSYNWVGISARLIADASLERTLDSLNEGLPIKITKEKFQRK